MANVSIKGKVARVGETSPGGPLVIHVTPDDPETLRGIDGSYKAGAGEVAIQLGRGAKAPKLGSAWQGTAEEVDAGTNRAHLKATATGGGKKGSTTEPAADEEDADEEEDTDEDDTTAGGKNA